MDEHEIAGYIKQIASEIRPQLPCLPRQGVRDVARGWISNASFAVMVDQNWGYHHPNMVVELAVFLEGKFPISRMARLKSTGTVMQRMYKLSSGSRRIKDLLGDEYLTCFAKAGTTDFFLFQDITGDYEFQCFVRTLTPLLNPENGNQVPLWLANAFAIELRKRDDESARLDPRNALDWASLVGSTFDTMASQLKIGCATPIGPFLLHIVRHHWILSSVEEQVEKEMVARAMAASTLAGFGLVIESEAGSEANFTIEEAADDNSTEDQGQWLPENDITDDRLIDRSNEPGAINQANKVAQLQNTIAMLNADNQRLKVEYEKREADWRQKLSIGSCKLQRMEASLDVYVKRCEDLNKTVIDQRAAIREAEQENRRKESVINSNKWHHKLHISNMEKRHAEETKRVAEEHERTTNTLVEKQKRKLEKQEMRKSEEFAMLEKKHNDQMQSLVRSYGYPRDDTPVVEAIPTAVESDRRRRRRT